MSEVIEKWLSSGDLRPCYFQSARNNYVLIRIEKNPDFEYLLCQCLYSKRSIEWKESFDYAGIYCKKDGLIYDADYSLSQTEEYQKSLKGQSAESLRVQLQKNVREKVENAVGNDKGNLNIAGITDERLLKRLEEFYQYGAKRNARAQYLSMEDWETPVYQCDYSANQWDEDSLLAYILSPEDYVQKEAKIYLAEKQERILYKFLENEAIEGEYQALVANKENPVHTIKKIMTAVRAVDAKMVHVTVCKDGMEFTFKTKTDELRRDCGKYYSTYDIVAVERRRFEELFGRHANYTPAEIVCITYAKKELYRAEA